MQNFYKGADISFLPQWTDEGMQVRDRDGSEIDAFALLKKYGVNSVRLRIWNDPARVPEAKGYCSLEHTLKMAEKIKENGMSFLLDFHYSDFWADPANQRKPAAWENLDFKRLREAVYAYTKDTLQAFEKEGLLPDMVQIGNEIRSGLLFPEGEVPDYAGMVKLVNAGIEGARAVAGPDRMKVMIHLDQGGRYAWLHEWFEKSFAAGLLDFDLIGLSYYPFWHGTFLDLEDSMKRLLEDYGKPILIVETAYAWRESDRGFIDKDQVRIGGVEASPEGQRRVLEYVMHLVAGLPGEMGRGVYYWEPLCIPRPEGSGWAENMGLLDSTGAALEGFEAFRQSRQDMEKEPEGFGALKRKLVSGSGVGRCKGGKDENGNLLSNGDFSNGMESWQIDEQDSGVAVSVEPEYGCLRVQAQKNFRFAMSRVIQIEQSGSYGVSAEVLGVDTTGVDIRLFAENGECRKEVQLHPTEHSREMYEIRNLDCSEGELKIGVRIASPAIYVSLGNFRVIREIDLGGQK